MIRIREKENGYGFIIALLLIIIIILISYIAYNKGLERNKSKEITTTTTQVDLTTTTKELLISREYTYDNICEKTLPCLKEITTIDKATIKLENDNNKQQIIITGAISKNIELEKFISLRIVDNKYYIIKSSEKENKENYILTLYDNKFNQLDLLNVNIYRDVTYENLDLTYYTYDIKCPDTQGEYYMKETASINDNGFKITSSDQGPLKTDGTVCKKITTN